MKKLFLLLVSMCVLIASCTSDNTDTGGTGGTDTGGTGTIELFPNILQFSYEGGIDYVKITSNIEYEISENIDWVVVEKCSGGVKVTVDESLDIDNKTAFIKIFNLEHNLSIRLEVEQTGLPADNVILYTANSKMLPYITEGYGAKLIKNIFKDNQGCLIFDGVVTEIPESAFRNGSMTSLIIPAGVTRMGDDMIRDAPNIGAVYCKSLQAPLIFYGRYYDGDFGTFHYKVNDCRVNIYIRSGATGYYGNESVSYDRDETYATAHWCKYDHRVKIADF